MKVAINRCFGGFGLSPIAIQLYLKKIGKECFFYKQTKWETRDGKQEFVKIKLEEYDGDVYHLIVYTKNMGEKFSKHDNDHYFYDSFYEKRDDKMLIETIEELGTGKASGKFAKIEIIEIPDGVEFEIQDYDGSESIHEKHRKW